MPETTTAPDVGSARGGDDLIGAAAALSNDELMEGLDGLFRQKAEVDGRIVVRLGEVGRREAYRDDGATSLETWVVARFGVSAPTARAYAYLAKKAWDVPHLVAGLCAGALSLDKFRSVAEVATPETDKDLADQARSCSVRQLAELARSRREPTPEDDTSAHQRRFVRFNDRCRTVTVQLPPESYAETRAFLESRARRIPSNGETRWDQRLCDAFMEIIRSALRGASGSGAAPSPYFVVVHVALDALLDEAGETTGLAGDLERGGLISCETVRRIACDATIVIGVDDDVGRTMYEGRARREPTDAQQREVRRRDRHCRFPGCTNMTFTNIHHVEPWTPDGRTDIDNLALVCLHHHHLVHSRGWTMSGDANEELTVVGPSGRVMTSRPSPMWTAATGGRRNA